MTEPKVYDVEGNRLAVEDRVRWLACATEVIGVIGGMEPAEYGQKVHVDYESGPGSAHYTDVNGRCMDLELIKDTKEENGGG